MEAQNRDQFETAARELEHLLQAHRISGRSATHKFESEMRKKEFHHEWSECWRKIVESMGGQIGLSTMMNILEEVTRLLDLAPDWRVIVLPKTIDELVQTHRFDGFTDLTLGTFPSDNKTRPAKKMRSMRRAA
jgi:hypothetical protein